MALAITATRSVAAWAEPTWAWPSRAARALAAARQLDPEIDEALDKAGLAGLRAR